MAQGFLNTEAEAWTKGSGGPACPGRLIRQQELQGIQLPFSETAKVRCPPPAHCWALSQELRDLGPVSTRAPHPTACPLLGQSWPEI